MAGLGAVPYVSLARILPSWRGTQMTRKTVSLTAACMLFGSILGWQAPAIAGSDNSSDTYAGDYQGGSLPTGTLIALQYAGFAHSNSFIDTAGNAVPNSHANTWEEFTRVAYFAQLFGHPLVIEAELPFATLTDVNLPIPGSNNGVASGLVDPVFHITYFFISDARTQRWLGLTNYVYLPLGRYDPHQTINVATAHQTTDVPQIGYTEGLAKFSPALNGLFFDFVGNVSIHSNGRDPINLVNPNNAPIPGNAIFDTLTQRPSYDVKAFLRYEPKTFQWIALGIEKSWGGEQIATNGRFVPAFPFSLVVPVSPLSSESLSKDDYLRGHLQFQFPVTQDFAIGGDIFHDFERVGGFKEDFGAEIRLTKFFFPPQRPSMPTK
jgi:Putative MetA-pathway of phenol degradation